ncbi:MAG: hypothetical protein Q9223_007458 [Gallowayella weberi]
MPGNTAAAATLGAQASSKDAQASVPNLPTRLSDSPAPASAPALDHSNTGQVLSLKIASTYETSPNNYMYAPLKPLAPASNVSQSKPSQSGSEQNLGTSKDSVQTRQDGTAPAVSKSSPMLTSRIQDRPMPGHSTSSSHQESLTTPKASSEPPIQIFTSSSGLQSLPSVGVISTHSGSSPLLLQQTMATVTKPGGSNVGQAPPTPTQRTERSALGLGTSSSLGSIELAVLKIPTNAPSLSPLGTSIASVSPAASLIRNSSGSKKPPRKTHHVVSVASITSLIPSNQTSVPSSLVESMPSSAIASMSSRNNTMLPLFKSTGNSSTATKSPQSSSSSAVSTSSNMSTTPTPQTTSSPPPPSPAEPLSSPLTVTPVDPPSNPSCHHPPSEPYEDVQPDNTEKAASTFCSEYDKQILHPGDAAVVKKLISLDSGADTGRITVEWVEGYSSDANVDGYTIGHPSLIKPLSSDSYGCKDILQNTYWGCKSNKGRAGCITAGCLKYCLNPGPDTVLPAKQPCTRHPCAEGQ